MRIKLRSKSWSALSVLYIPVDLSSKNVDTKDGFLSVSRRTRKEKFSIRMRRLCMSRFCVTEFNSPKCRGRRDRLRVTSKLLLTFDSPSDKKKRENTDV